MNNVEVSTIPIPTLISILVSLRWLRRAMTILLILSNLALTLWANAPR